MFSDQVKSVRCKLGLSQKSFAGILGVSFSTINRWENSKNEPSTLAQNSFYDFCENNFIDVEELKKL
jgi:putative transcriptional regulator